MVDAKLPCFRGALSRSAAQLILVGMAEGMEKVACEESSFPGRWSQCPFSLRTTPVPHSKPNFAFLSGTPYSARHTRGWLCLLHFADV